tara:strand:- start:1 stop:165 length:165 start_codon:yes stop_codon:yes gene_type:complete
VFRSTGELDFIVNVTMHLIRQLSHLGELYEGLLHYYRASGLKEKVDGAVRTAAR